MGLQIQFRRIKGQVLEGFSGSVSLVKWVPGRGTTIFSMRLRQFTRNTGIVSCTYLGMGTPTTEANLRARSLVWVSPTALNGMSSYVTAGISIRIWMFVWFRA